MIVQKCFILLTILLVNGRSTRGERPSDFRIVGGRDIEITEAPYQVSLLRKGEHTCGGIIVDIYIIITAAHCVAGEPVTYFHIRAGSSFSSHGGQVIPVGDMIVHQGFALKKKKFDVAVLWLKYPLQVNAAVRAVMMIDDGVEIPDGSITTVTGWGLTSEHGGFPSKLQKVQVPIVNQQECSANYDTIYSSEILCAGYRVGGKDSCYGDSGGPLIYNGILVGVVSRGDGCARPYTPGIYIKVSALRKWLDYSINSLIQKNTVGGGNNIYADYY